MHDFVPGQRWINDADSQLGLGTVLSVEHRIVTILYSAIGETRSYARQSAPLTRVRFSHGDNILAQDGWGLTVESVDEVAGLITYIGTDENDKPARLEEAQLNNFIQLNRPTERLFNGQIDSDKWYELRYQTQLYNHQLAHSDLRGLTGCRTSLLPHQLYIAHEVANRYAPRVLLADEVGLGKTIEAGLVLHHQLLTERAKRVLILLPESLVHQWLVEMLRRFNLLFSIFDQERCAAIDENEEQINPFHTEQLVLCNIDFLIHQPERMQQALDGEWDLLVVDEAHHLAWSPEQSSPEYLLVEQLARVTKGVLLLTATPEQLGKESHFARLRLLDPDRFHDFDAFVDEENSYEPIAKAVEILLDQKPLTADATETLTQTIQEGDNQKLLEIVQDSSSGESEQEAARQALAEHLLDRHGTGRVLFRNTRAAVKGFPQRNVSAHPLPLPVRYAESAAATQDLGIDGLQLLLSPELLYQDSAASGDPHWTQIDPRINWLIELLTKQKSGKVLIITSSAGSAMDIAQSIRIESGIHAAVFHEYLSIVERDRAAAFFADQETGSPVLVCSEIGSEGRNFQFAHQLVLFDLPLNPDLLEQRIGRLDRLGQRKDIRIHVPCLENSALETMFHWYHEGLNAFEHTCPAGHAVYTQVQDELHHALRSADSDTEELIEKTRILHKELNETLQRGRNRLLEYNSCRPHIASSLQQRALLQGENAGLPEYMEQVFDCFGVDTALHSEGCHIIRPGEHMLTRFPGIPDDGMTVTYDRDIALANEDVHYITWEHPLTISAIDMAMASELGNTTVAAVGGSNIKPGTLLLECLYILEPAAVKDMQTNRYLPPTTIRVVIDEQGIDHAGDLTHEFIRENQSPVVSKIANQIVRVKEQALRSLVNHSEQIAKARIPDIVTAAHDSSHQVLTAEASRLNALRQINPNVRTAEIDFFEAQLGALQQILDSATLRLDALRVLVTT